MTGLATQIDSRQIKSRTGLWLGVSVVAGLACAAIGFSSPGAFWSGYLVAAIFWMSISTGCLAIALVHGVSGGRWGRLIGRSLHSGINTHFFALVACWFTALGASYVFPWAGDEAQQAALNPHQKIWLAPTAVAIRFAVICALWLLYGMWLNRRYPQDARDPLSEVTQAPAAFGILLFFISYSIVAIDFMMSLSPAWSSSMYPLIRIMNCAVAGLAFCSIIQNSQLMNPTQEQLDRVLDIGNLLQAFNLLWTYVSFSQYILIWTGDIAGEVQWFIDRRSPFWLAIAYVLFALHFAVPFLLLLSRNVKRGLKWQSTVSAILLAMCLLDIAWTLLPSIPVSTLPAVLSVCTGTLAIGGIWMIVFLRSFNTLPDMAMEDDEHAAAHHAIHPIPGDSI